MKLSKKSAYGLRALLELTLAHGSTMLQRQDIASRQHIPIEFLEQILLSLKRAGLLASQRGAKESYTLVKPPKDISLSHVIRILDGPLAPIGCVSKTAYQTCNDCPYANKTQRPVQHMMGAVRDAIADILNTYSLADFISGYRKT